MDHTKFTPELKDHVLKSLCSSLEPYKRCSFDCRQICDDSVLFNTCMCQFQDRNFVISPNIQGSNCSVVITANAIDFLNRGGFVFEEQILISNLQKIQLELENLKSETTSKSQINKIANISAIISNTISAACTLIGKTL